MEVKRAFIASGVTCKPLSGAYQGSFGRAGSGLSVSPLPEEVAVLGWSIAIVEIGFSINKNAVIKI